MEKVKAAMKLETKLLKKGLQPDQVDEIVMHEVLAPQNPDWHPEDWKELPEETEKLLDEFKDSQGI